MDRGKRYNLAVVQTLFDIFRQQTWFGIPRVGFQQQCFQHRFGGIDTLVELQKAGTVLFSESA